MKRILLITRPIAPPWDEASKNFAFYFAKNTLGFEFHLLTHGIIPNMPDHVSQENIYTSNDFNFFQKLRSFLYQIKSKNKFDIAHYFFTPTAFNSFLIRNFIKNAGTKSIQTIATLREDLFSDKKIKKLIFGDLVITYSDHAKNKLNSLGFGNVRRIYPGIDLGYYFPAQKDEKMLATFEIQPSDFVVTYPGEYTRLGATDDIVNLILQYSSAWRDKNIKFIFACRLKSSKDIMKKEEVMKKIKSGGAADSVVFVNTYPDMAKLYNLSDVIIFPVQDMKGKFDVPLAAIEPMACEKTVIISDLPILSEFAKPEHSVIIKKGNIKQLKSAILDLYANPEKRKLIGRNAREFAKENFDIKKVAGKYSKIYNEL